MYANGLEKQLARIIVGWYRCSKLTLDNPDCGNKIISLMIYTIIPAKPFTQSKTRLSPVLTATERINLSNHLLRRTIGVAQTVGPVVVVSRSSNVRKLAKACHAWALVENTPDLNAALRQGIEWVKLKGGDSILILPADLPRLTSKELQSLVKKGAQHPAMVIAPCRRNQGTNALLLHPPNLILPQFGPNSFAAHLSAARAIEIDPQIHRSAGLSLDLDTPEDWQMLISKKRFDVAHTLQ